MIDPETTDVEMTAAERKPGGFDPALRRLAIVVVLGAIMTILDTTITNVAVNTLGRAFGTSLSTIQWVLTGYTLALSMSIPLSGWAIARFGAKTMWITSLLLFIGGSVLCGLAWDVTSLVGFRLLQGFGAGMIMPIGQTMLARAAGPDRMGRVMSVVSIPAMLAPVLGPVVGGLILDHLSWRWMFYVNVPFCLIAVVAAIRLLPADAIRDRGSRLDVLGLLLLSPGLGALVYGTSEVGQGVALTDARVLAGVLGGVALVAAYLVHAARKGRAALVDTRLLRNRNFAAVNGVLFAYVGALFALMALVPLYFQVVVGDTPLKSGLMMAPLGLGAMVTMPFSGRLTDRISPRLLVFCSLPVVLLGMLGLTQVDADTGRVPLIALMFAIGLGHGMMMPAAMGSSYRTLDRSEISSATTTVNVGMRVASSFGVAALLVLLQRNVEQELPGVRGSVAAVAEAGPPARVASLLSAAFTHTFWWALVIAAVALVPAALMQGRARPAPGRRPAEEAAGTVHSGH
ncbi:multidrug efflux MFS transporter [Amycolatopsis sp. NBC_00355]|uniref:MDR family MFS transporter n=1 Tax=Amycolatopsis sp. NBC_00355 TaxID=2975957 RepID=UPI002E262769